MLPMRHQRVGGMHPHTLDCVKVNEVGNVSQDSRGESVVVARYTVEVGQIACSNCLTLEASLGFGFPEQCIIVWVVLGSVALIAALGVAAKCFCRPTSRDPPCHPKRDSRNAGAKSSDLPVASVRVEMASLQKRTEGDNDSKSNEVLDWKPTHDSSDSPDSSSEEESKQESLDVVSDTNHHGRHQRSGRKSHHRHKSRQHHHQRRNHHHHHHSHNHHRKKKKTIVSEPEKLGERQRRYSSQELQRV